MCAELNWLSGWFRDQFGFPVNLVRGLVPVDSDSRVFEDGKGGEVEFVSKQKRYRGVAKFYMSDDELFHDFKKGTVEFHNENWSYAIGRTKVFFIDVLSGSPVMLDGGTAVTFSPAVLKELFGVAHLRGAAKAVLAGLGGLQGWTQYSLTVTTGKWIECIGVEFQYQEGSGVGTWFDDVALIATVTDYGVTPGTPSDTPVPTDDDAYWSQGVNIVICLVILLGPAVGLVIAGLGKWGFMSGLVIGAVVGNRFLGESIVPLYLVVLVAVAVAAMAYTSISHGG